jgi:hypothetical protein
VHVQTLEHGAHGKFCDQTSPDLCNGGLVHVLGEGTVIKPWFDSASSEMVVKLMVIHSNGEVALKHDPVATISLEFLD